MKIVFDLSELPFSRVFYKKSREKMKASDWAWFWLNDLPGFLALVYGVYIVLVLILR